MHPWKATGQFLILLGLIVDFSAAAAVVYKWTDADGVVHYSDQAVPGAEKIVTSSATSNGIGGAPSVRSTSPMLKPAPPKVAALGRILIESPTKEQVFFADEVVPVQLHLEPDLQPNQHVVWYLNGVAQTDLGPSSLAFSLPSLERGTYVLSASVTDSMTDASQTAESVTFYVRQPSDLAPLNPLRKK